MGIVFFLLRLKLSAVTKRPKLVSRATNSQATLKELVTAEYTDTNPKPSKPEAKDKTTALQQLTDQLGNVTGWSNDWRQAGRKVSALTSNAILHIPGWILTIIAVSLGAPFWFDTLNRFVNIRAAGKRPAKGATSSEA